MRIEEKRVGDVLILTPVTLFFGEQQVVILSERVRTAIVAGDKKVIVNLEKTEFTNASGLSGLTTIFSLLRSSEGDLKLIVKGKIKSLFILTGLNSFFEIFEREEEAVKSFNPR